MLALAGRRPRPAPYKLRARKRAMCKLPEKDKPKGTTADGCGYEADHTGRTAGGERQADGIATSSTSFGHVTTARACHGPQPEWRNDVESAFCAPRLTPPGR